MTYSILILLQLSYGILNAFIEKVNTKRDITIYTLVNTVLYGIWLLATTIGVYGVVNGDILMGVIYAVSGSISVSIPILLHRLGWWKDDDGR